MNNFEKAQILTAAIRLVREEINTFREGFDESYKPIPGPRGEPGTTIDSIRVVNDQLIIETVDGEIINAGIIPIGPQGERGKTGVMGPTGVIGPHGGPPGPRGPEGPLGRRGPLGESGPLGKRGNVGVQGVPGSRGHMGPSGPRGGRGESVDVQPLKEDIDERITDLSKELHTQITARLNILTRSGGSQPPGSGSYQIMDNADVIYKRLDAMANNDILIFDSGQQKFVSLALTATSVVTDLTSRIVVLENEVGIVPFTSLIDVFGSNTFIGEAIAGTANNSPNWRIKVIDEGASPDINIYWANGQVTFVHQWDGRRAKSYS